MSEQKKLTGYPSIDKPWLKYYPQGVIDRKVPSKTMYRFIYDANMDRIDNVAMVYFDKKITYREMFNNIQKMANAFVQNGIGKGDIVSIISLNTPETIYCIYALNAIGAVANLILATITKQEIVEHLENTKSKILIVLDKILENIDGGFNVPVVVLSVADSAGGIAGTVMRLTAKTKNEYVSYKQFTNVKVWEFEEADAADAPAIIVYTSGSTGVPKGVVLSNNNLNSCAWQCYLSGKDYKPDEQFLNILPPFISFGIGMLHLCFFTGMKEIICIVPQISNIHKLMKKYRPERFVLGPAIIDSIEKYKDDLPYLIDLTGGGGAISLEKERQINQLLVEKNSKSKYLAGYGMTELSSAVSMNHNDRWKEQSIGLPLPFTNMKVIDVDSGQELGYGEEGELLVSSPGMMLEYYNNISETNNTIELINGERWLHTGDLAKIDVDGFVFVTGRLKRIYTVKGEDSHIYKLFPQRMEEVIQQINGIEKCGVIIVPDEARQSIPVLFVTIDSNAGITEDFITSMIMNVIDKSLPSYYKPRNVVVLMDMPITSSQKVDYRKLEKMVE